MIGEQPNGTLAVEKVTPKPQLHTTVLNSKCLEAVRRRYIEKDVIPPGIAALVGTGVDRSVTRNLGNKIRTRELLTIEEVADTARDGLNQAWEQGVRLEPEEIAAGINKVKGEALDKAVRLAVLHAKAKAPEIEPTAVQRKWELELGGYPLDLVGTIDITEATVIRDTKTSGKTPAENVAQRSVQLAAYAMAIWKIDGTAPESVALDYLIDNKTPQSKTFTAVKDIEDFRAVLARVEVIARCFESGLFPPVEPEHWQCSERFCGYATSCPYFVAKPKQFAV